MVYNTVSKITFATRAKFKFYHHYEQFPMLVKGREYIHDVRFEDMCRTRLSQITDLL